MKHSELKEMVLETYHRLNEGQAFDVDSTKPYVDALTKLGKQVGWSEKPTVSTLGGKEQVSILWRFTFDKKEEWKNGIVQNGLDVVFHIFNNGVVELANKTYKIKTKFRKSRFKDAKGLVAKIQKFIDAGKKELNL